MKKLIQSSIGTKMVSQWSDLMCNLAYDAVKCVTIEKNGKKEIDIKRYARIEKVNFIMINLNIDNLSRFLVEQLKIVKCWMVS